MISNMLRSPFASQAGVARSAAVSDQVNDVSKRKRAEQKESNQGYKCLAGNFTGAVCGTSSASTGEG
jgi:hypothetical protein